MAESLDEILTALERVSEDLLAPGAALDDLAGPCAERERLAARLAALVSGEMSAAEASRLEAVVELGDAAMVRLLEIRGGLAAEASALEVQRRWSDACRALVPEP